MIDRSYLGYTRFAMRARLGRLGLAGLLIAGCTGGILSQQAAVATHRDAEKQGRS